MGQKYNGFVIYKNQTSHKTPIYCRSNVVNMGVKCFFCQGVKGKFSMVIWHENDKGD